MARLQDPGAHLGQERREEQEVLARDEPDLDVAPAPEALLEDLRGRDPGESAAQDQHPMRPLLGRTPCCAHAVMMLQMAFADWRGAAAAAFVGSALVACAAPTTSIPGPSATASLIESHEPTPRVSFPASLPPQTPLGIVFRLSEQIASFVPHLTLYDDGRLVRWDRPDDLTVQRLNPMEWMPSWRRSREWVVQCEPHATRVPAGR
jgi:hypothetical protein